MLYSQYHAFRCQQLKLILSYCKSTSLIKTTFSRTEHSLILVLPQTTFQLSVLRHTHLQRNALYNNLSRDRLYSRAGQLLESNRNRNLNFSQSQ